MRNNIKAIIYVVVGFSLTLLVGVLAFMMWLSPTFLPVYINGEFVIGNRILRIFLYLVMFAIMIGLFVLANYGLDFLIKKVRRNLRRR